MELLAYYGLLLGSTWASGINLYLTMAGLGLAHRMAWIALPGELEVLADPIVIAAALILYIIEFVADKVPYVDSAWDAVHTAIRPIGGAALAYLAAADANAFAQTATAIMGGAVALDAHMMKASSRVAINASPEPFSNTAASLAEDACVLGSIWLIIKHPVVIAVLVILFFGLSIWLLPKLFRFFKKIFIFLFKRKAAQL
ncbi:MAG: DUF4126 domain-containing protein [Candidatus Omnitrophota bacterium]|nr:DUF4126 domain-containing protein [Candidatus Omnitrophota bacterium]